MENPASRLEPHAPDVKEHEAFFARNLTTANDIIHICISGRVEQSGYPMASEAAGAFENVTVFDSGHLSSGQGLLALIAARAAEDGKRKDEILELLENEKKNISTSFIVDNLDFLSRTGQVGPRVANFTKALMLHPVIAMKRGRMRISKVTIGSRQDAWRKYIRSVLRNPSKIDNSILFITSSGLSKKDNDFIRDEVEKRMHFEEIHYMQASPAIATNCGPGCFGLLFRKLGNTAEY